MIRNDSLHEQVDGKITTLSVVNTPKIVYFIFTRLNKFRNRQPSVTQMGVSLPTCVQFLKLIRKMMLKTKYLPTMVPNFELSGFIIDASIKTFEGISEDVIYYNI